MYMDILESVQNFFDPRIIIDFFKSPKVLWYVIGFVFLIYAIISCILLYHWRKYGMHGKLIKGAEILYFSVSVALFALMILFAYLI